MRNYRQCLAASAIFFFFNDTATTEIYTLSLHDALPIYDAGEPDGDAQAGVHRQRARRDRAHVVDRKSTRLNSSHVAISYAVFCLKKKTYGSCPECIDSVSRPGLSCRVGMRLCKRGRVWR